MTVYDLLAPVYGAWTALFEVKAHRRAAALLGKSPCQHLLEVAVGTGTEFALLSTDPGRTVCVGVDLSAAMLAQARRKIEPGARAILCQADVRALPFRAASFDCLLSCYLIDLVPESDITVVLEEFARVLRPEGRLVLVVMAEQAPVVQQAWMMLFRHVPALVGGCRPIPAANWLRTCGWHVERQEQITQCGFRSELLLARPRF